MKRIWMLLLLAMPALHAEETQPVPPHDEFVEGACLPAMLREVGDAPAQRTVARAACECSYRQLSHLETMNQAQFGAAATVCQYEFELDGAAFLQKYSAGSGNP